MSITKQSPSPSNHTKYLCNKKQIIRKATEPTGFKDNRKTDLVATTRSPEKRREREWQPSTADKSQLRDIWLRTKHTFSRLSTLKDSFCVYFFTPTGNYA